MTTATHVDANLHHDQLTGRAVTTCFQLVNATTTHWDIKRQATVETATFGSKVVAARIATIQVQTSQSIKEVQAWMGSSKRLCTGPTT